MKPLPSRSKTLNASRISSSMSPSWKQQSLTEQNGAIPRFVIRQHLPREHSSSLNRQIRWSWCTHCHLDLFRLSFPESCNIDIRFRFGSWPFPPFLFICTGCMHEGTSSSDHTGLRREAGSWNLACNLSLVERAKTQNCDQSHGEPWAYPQSSVELAFIPSVHFHGG